MNFFTFFILGGQRFFYIYALCQLPQCCFIGAQRLIFQKFLMSK